MDEPPTIADGFRLGFLLLAINAGLMLAALMLVVWLPRWLFGA